MAKDVIDSRELLLKQLQSYPPLNDNLYDKLINDFIKYIVYKDHQELLDNKKDIIEFLELTNIFENEIITDIDEYVKNKSVLILQELIDKTKKILRNNSQKYIEIDIGHYVKNLLSLYNIDDDFSKKIKKIAEKAKAEAKAEAEAETKEKAEVEKIIEEIKKMVSENVKNAKKTQAKAKETEGVITKAEHKIELQKLLQIFKLFQNTIAQEKQDATETNFNINEIVAFLTLLSKILDNSSSQSNSTNEELKSAVNESVLKLFSLLAKVQPKKGGNSQTGGDINDNNYKQIKMILDKLKNYKNDIEAVMKEFNETKDNINKEAKAEEEAKAKTETPSSSEKTSSSQEITQAKKEEKQKKEELITLQSYDEKLSKMSTNIDNYKKNIKIDINNLKSLVDKLYKEIQSNRSPINYNEDIKKNIKKLHMILENYSQDDNDTSINREFIKYKADIENKKSDLKIQIDKVKAKLDIIERDIKSDQTIKEKEASSPQKKDPTAKELNYYKGGGSDTTLQSNNSDDKDFKKHFRTLEQIISELNALQTNLEEFYEETSYSKNVSKFNIPSIYEDIWNEYVKTKKTIKAENAEDKNLQKLKSVDLDNTLYDKIKLYNLDPSTVLKITFEDKAIFILVTFVIRLITVIFLELLIDYNIIRTLHYSMIIYGMIYIAIIIILIITINYDSYKLRILINYLNLHINSGKIYTHIFLFILFISLVYIMVKSQDTLNNFGDLFDFTNIYKHIYEITESNKEVSDIRLSQNEKLKLQYRIDIISMIVFIFTSLLIMVL